MLSRILRTASFRVAALHALLFSGAALALGAIVFVIASQGILDVVGERIEGATARLQSDYNSQGLAVLIGEVASRGGMGLEYLVQGPDGESLAGSLPPVGTVRGWHDFDTSQPHQPTRHTRVLAVELENGVVLAVGESLRRVEDVDATILRAFAWAGGLIVLLSIISGAVVSRTFLRRVDAITRTAEAIIDGDVQRRVPLRGTGDDLDHLAATLNRMLDRIAALMESLRQVSSDIAHDLRTPLSRLSHRLEEARTQVGSASEREAAIEAAAIETTGILETFSAVLRIAQVEGGERRRSFKDIDLSAVVETVTEAFQPSSEDESHALETQIDPGVTISGDRQLLSQLLANLIENGLRHTPPGTRILVSLHRTARGGARLAVRDNGPGVPSGERDRIVRRFYRCEQSRTTPGNGLGLSLVAAVAELHGAELRIEDANPGLSVELAIG